MTSNRSTIQRRNPKQARSRATWEAIVEAASQILERGGPDALNTSNIAERAGVSIGTLYQYFPDKQAILFAAAQRELDGDQAAPPSRQKALIRALIRMVETIGRSGSNAGPPAMTADAPSPVVRKTRGGRTWERRCEDGVQRLLDTLVAPLVPALTPIPVRTRRR